MKLNSQSNQFSRMKLKKITTKKKTQKIIKSTQVNLLTLNMDYETMITSKF